VLAGPACQCLTPPLPCSVSLLPAPSRCPPSLTSPGPTYQPLAPASLAPPPSSPIAAVPTAPVRHAPPATVRAARRCCIHAVPVYVAVPRPPSLYPIFSSTRHRTPDPHPSPAPVSKGAGRCACTLFSSPLALLRPWPHKRHTLPSFSRLLSTPVIEPPWSSSHFRPPLLPFLPPIVRPAYPPPLPYFGPPSPLSSSLAAPRASRSCRRPSLRRGPHRTSPHPAAS
jgi:hypothetical protein